jgi:hypothetical protein
LNGEADVINIGTQIMRMARTGNLNRNHWVSLEM